MFDYLSDSHFQTSIIPDNLVYFENVKVLTKNGVGILEQLLLEQDCDTNTKINLIHVLISIGINLNSSFSRSKRTPSEIDTELNEIGAKLSIIFKDSFNNKLNVQNENYIQLFRVI